MEEIIQALQLKTQLDTLRPIDKEQENRLMQKFRLDWNYHSNHLEGNSLTYGETKALILFGVTAQGKPLKDTLEITGHNEAINWVLEMIQGERPLTENFIRELHSLLLQDSYKESKNSDGKMVPRKITSGKYKTTPNHVETATGEIFYFASPEETPAKMHDLLSWYDEKASEKDINPLLVAAEFHYKFIRIHPFDDGNGRTARILMNFILMQFGFPPVIIKTEDKANYFAALQFADAGNIEAFINYIAQNLVRSLEIMIAGANGESIEEDDDLDKEIALLEQRVIGLGKKSEVQISNKVITDLINIDFINLSNHYESISAKLKKMYFSNEYKVFIGTREDEPIFGLSSIRHEELNHLDYKNNLYNDTIEEIVLKINFNTFKVVGFGEFDFSSEVRILLHKSSYKLFYGEKSFQKSYGTQLTDSEIDKIVKSEVKRHKEFIEQKIAEKENK